MKEIKLYNRDGANLKLISEDDELYKFDVDKDHDYIFEYMRCGYKNDNKTLSFIDPSGGPFISIGSTINDKYFIDSIIIKNNNIYIKLNELN